MNFLNNKQATVLQGHSGPVIIRKNLPFSYIFSGIAKSGAIFYILHYQK